jgi:Delta14-sterol reductase
MEYLAPVLGVTLATYLLTALLPGRRVEGYCLDPTTGRPQIYKLNGLRVLVVVIGLFCLGVRWIPATVFFDGYLGCSLIATATGLIASTGFLLRGFKLWAEDRIDRRDRCPTKDSLEREKTTRDTKATKSRRSPSPSARKRSTSPSVGKRSPSKGKAPNPSAAADTAEFDSRSLLEHFYCGLSEFNPRGPLGVDIKMWLYVVGAVLLFLNVLSCLAAAPSSLAMRTYAALMAFFVLEYKWNEAIHLQTYDLFRERIGFKLLFGCLAFYPYFYATGGFAIASWGNKAAHFPAWACALTVVLFFSGWTLTRGANLQKAACKEGKKNFSFLFGLIKPSMEILPGSNGRILCGGFWGLSRHINYLGEIIQAVALSLPALWVAGGIRMTGATSTEIFLSILPLLYPLYYVGLFIPRCIDDGKMCEKKYGQKLWQEYCSRVKWNMVPGVW